MSIDGPGVLESDLGHDDDLHARLSDLLASGRSAAQWERAADTKVAKARAIVLTRLLGQLRSARAKPRPRKKYASPDVRFGSILSINSVEVPNDVHCSGSRPKADN